MNNKEIWIISHFAGSPAHGMVYRPYYLGKNFSQLNETTRIFASSFSHVRNLNPNVEGFFSEELIDGIIYTWIRNIKYYPSNKILRFSSLALFCISLLILPIWKFEKPKVIVVSSPSIFPIFNGWLWSKIFRCKLIFEVRDLWPESLIQLGNIKRTHPVVILIKLMERFAYKVCDICIAVMPTAHDYFSAEGLNLKKLNIIPNGTEDSELISSELSIELPEGFIVGFAGAVGNANNLDLMIDTAKQIEDNSVQFVIVGHGEEKSRLKEKARILNLKNIHFYDSIPKSEIPALLNQFDLCFISLKYTQLFDYGVSPNKLFDYMLARKPIVYCINSGNSPVLDARCGVEVRENSPKLVSKAILNLKNEGIDKLRELGNNGYDYVIKFHSYDSLSRDYLEKINE
ncbi:MAG: hypothetical protein CME65_04455 [Halobacteriovoraceae bacterium]|nr:hypothetical protein [Halobacteriovoraceae bacterium]|tara:strand:- start:6419 stop:7621 length:1203 start_codon:yes stop_codon:yes gene_type:complete